MTTLLDRSSILSDEEFMPRAHPPFTQQYIMRFDRVEKSVMQVAARRSGLSLNQFLQMAAMEYVRRYYPDLRFEEREVKWCRNCRRVLAHRDNESGFCRACQRKVGLPELRKIYGS